VSRLLDSIPFPPLGLGNSREAFQELGGDNFLWTGKASDMVTRISRFVADFIEREDGPTAVEYAVMLALIIVVCVSAITALGSNANATFTGVSNVIGSAS
jgi:pilus assembly protein Flp/PilA